MRCAVPWQRPAKPRGAHPPKATHLQQQQVQAVSKHLRRRRLHALGQQSPRRQGPSMAVLVRRRVRARPPRLLLQLLVSVLRVLLRHHHGRRARRRAAAAASTLAMRCSAQQAAAKVAKRVGQLVSNLLGGHGGGGGVPVPVCVGAAARGGRGRRAEELAALVRGPAGAGGGGRGGRPALVVVSQVAGMLGHLRRQGARACGRTSPLLAFRVENRRGKAGHGQGEKVEGTVAFAPAPEKALTRALAGQPTRLAVKQGQQRGGDCEPIGAQHEHVPALAALPAGGRVLAARRRRRR